MYEYDLGNHHMPITTTREDAQLWYDRGLIWTYGFNHEEAVACFRRAIEADPDCAMAYWGLAYASGPNYNMPWDLYDDAGRIEALAKAFDAAQDAAARKSTATPEERALIDALSVRYPQRDVTDDMSSWDDAYAHRMRAVHAQFPENLDIRCLAVEAMMTRTPWEMWDLRSDQPAKEADTLLCQSLLEDAFDTDPAARQHPGLLHFYVHLMEMSPFPEKALKAGDTLRHLAPDAGHMVHMSSHIDVQCGDYADVVLWNEKAIEADLKFYEREGAFNIYTGYRQHNYHFVIYGAMMLGQLEPARRAVRGMEETTPEDLLRIESPPMADFFESYLAFEPHVLVRFGLWEEAIAMPLPSDPVLYCTKAVFVLYARTVAYAALGRVDEALQAEQAFLEAARLVPESRRVHNNSVRDLLDIAREMARGEILYRQGDYVPAYKALRHAVILEDHLAYDEPWGWMQPSRHALGALLLEQGHADEAEAVYRADLGLGGTLPRAQVHPDNVWALRGLYDCLTARGETVERVHIRARLDLALARADRAVAASCFCAQSAMRATGI